jgi:hypothetical protein
MENAKFKMKCNKQTEVEPFRNGAFGAADPG